MPPPKDTGYRASLSDTLRWDPSRCEPYLQLPSFPSVRITPFREEGMAPALERLFNEPQIGRRLYRLPYPMSLEYAEEWVQEELGKEGDALEELKAGLENPPPSTAAGSTPAGSASASASVSGSTSAAPSASTATSVSGLASGSHTSHNCRTDHHPRSPHLRRSPDAPLLKNLPFRSIRLQGTMVGDVGLHPSEPEKDGDPEWTLGYVLSSSAEGAGIMSESVGVILAFAEEWMKVDKIEAIVEDDNPRSISVLERNGFRRVGDTVTLWPEEKGGGERRGGRYLWTSAEDSREEEGGGMREGDL